MMHQLFNILKEVDSSNNYAMGKVHEGLARHGMAWFAIEQVLGKGQRGKIWNSKPGENIILSVAVQPSSLFEVSKFYFNALVSVTIRNFVQELCTESVFIKWPNDIYICDKKAGGILIENIVNSTSWKWSVIGIGLNINQETFENGLINATSVFQISKKKQEIIDLSQKLHKKIVEVIDNYSKSNELTIIKEYNSYLYNVNIKTSLKDSNGSFEGIIKCVDENGNLKVETDKIVSYKFGEIQWVPVL